VDGKYGEEILKAFVPLVKSFAFVLGSKTKSFARYVKCINDKNYTKTMCSTSSGECTKKSKMI